uniref:COP9 signalosome complex subunit 4 n=1 Tax=Panagrellus redivivus TaxID=6233 RepID=A0A7E4VXL8_PANRE
MTDTLVARATTLSQRNATCDEVVQLSNEIVSLCHDQGSVETAMAAVKAIVLQDNAGLVQRQIFSDIADGLKPPIPLETIKYVANGILNLLLSRAIAYDDVIRKLRMLLSESFEEEGEFGKAADVLLSTVSETSQKSYPNRAQMLLRLANLCLKSNKLEDADQVVNRISLIQHELDSESLARFNYFAGLLADRRARFIDAATRFYPLSTNVYLTPTERREVLKKAMICVVLSPDTPMRQRILPAIVGDDRCRSIEGFALIEKMFMSRLITQSDIDTFETLLEPHHRVGGKDPVSKFVVEHNIVALSKLFRNISFTKLQTLLNKPFNEIQRTIAEMVIQKRLKCKIDQATNTVSFNPYNHNLLFDHFFRNACQGANTIHDQIIKKYPEWVAKNFTEAPQV